MLQAPGPGAQSAMPRSAALPRARPGRLLARALAAVAVFKLAPSFVPGPRPHLRSPAATARRAEGDGKPGEEDGGFLKFLKVEQDIELSPEEYALALEQEVESQRKRYYINGEIKPNNLIVPWKPVDEKQVEADARRTLKKNGIKDPSGEVQAYDEDSLVDIQLIGEQDVRLEWTGGEPGKKVGYIVEKKRTQDTNFQEIGSYENMQTAFLLVQTYKGHEYEFTDQIVNPGTYNYRVLCRFRSGEIAVVDQKDIIVPELGGVDNTTALIALGLLSVALFTWGFLDDPIIT